MAEALPNNIAMPRARTRDEPNRGIVSAIIAAVAIVAAAMVVDARLNHGV